MQAVFGEKEREVEGGLIGYIDDTSPVGWMDGMKMRRDEGMRRED